MQIRIRLFASLRELQGASEVTLEVPAGTSVDQVLTLLFADARNSGRFPKSLLYAVNQEYVSPNHVVQPGDEVVFVPPVSGG